MAVEEPAVGLLPTSSGPELHGRSIELQLYLEQSSPPSQGRQSLVGRLPGGEDGGGQVPMIPGPTADPLG